MYQLSAVAEARGTICDAVGGTRSDLRTECDAFVSTSRSTRLDASHRWFDS